METKEREKREEEKVQDREHIVRAIELLSDNTVKMFGLIKGIHLEIDSLRKEIESLKQTNGLI